MTPKERILAVLNGKPTDKLPYQEVFFSNRKISEYFGGPQNSMEDAAKFIANSEQCSITIGGFWWTPSSSKKETSLGDTKYAGGHTFTMEEINRLSEPEIERTISLIDENINIAKRYNLATHIWIMNGFHSASTSMGLENFCYTLYDAPEVADAFIERIERFNRKVLKKLEGKDIDIVFIDGDCAYKTGLMIRPELFRKIWFQPTKKTIEICQDNGWHYCYHSDGKIDDLYPLLIELGFSGTHGVEAAANDLADIKSRFGDRLTLFGNFDVVDLTMRSHEEIRLLTKKMLDVGAPNGRYLAACNTIVGESIPLENYLVYQKTISDYCLNR